MAKRVNNPLNAVAAFLFLAAGTPAFAQQPVQVEETVTTTVTTTYSDGTTEITTLSEGESIGPDGRIVKSAQEESDENLRGLAKQYSHFTWGASIGISADLSGMDMSTFNFDILAGYRNKWFQAIGVGAGVHKSLGSRDSYIPVYAVLRTSFRPKPSLCFFHLRLGYSFNTISNSPMFGDTSAAIGCGVNLMRTRKMQSYILLAYAFRHFNQRHTEMTNLSRSDVSLAQVSFGVTF